MNGSNTPSMLLDFNPPMEIIEAAQKLQEYFLREHNRENWQFMHVESRNFKLAAPATQQMTDEQISDLADRIADETGASCQWGEAYDTALAAIKATLALVNAPVAKLEAQLDRAERALQRSGFQDLGGQEWKPPLGKPPVFIEVPAAPASEPSDTRTVAQIAHEVHHTCMRIPGANFYTAAEMALEQAITIIAAPVALECLSTVNTLGGFKGGFAGLHRRAPTEQEIWNAGVRSGLDRQQSAPAQEPDDASFEQHWATCGFVPDGANPDHIYAAMKSAWDARALSAPVAAPVQEAIFARKEVTREQLQEMYPASQRNQFEATMGDALKEDQGEWALTKAYDAEQSYTFLATKLAWKAWQTAQIASAQDRLPRFMVRTIAAAIAEATSPKGMSLHDGKARIDASILSRLLAIAEAK